MNRNGLDSSAGFMASHVAVHRPAPMDRTKAVRAVSRMIEQFGEDEAREFARMLFTPPNDTVITDAGRQVRR